MAARVRVTMVSDSYRQRWCAEVQYMNSQTYQCPCIIWSMECKVKQAEKLARLGMPSALSRGAPSACWALAVQPQRMLRLEVQVSASYKLSYGHL